MSGRTWRDLGAVVVIVALLGAATLLPPDTSLRVVRDRGSLRVCVPEAYPPLVTPDAERPGIDVELADAIAEDLGLRLQLVPNPSIGRDFNPRNWRINRAQCEIIAGGVVATDLTRSFLETTPPHLQTGWAIVHDGAVGTLEGATVGFAPGASGLDRIELSRYLRSIEAEVRRLPDLAALEAALLADEVDAGVSEALIVRTVAGRHDWTAAYLPEPLEPAPITLGLWKGDLTLLRAVRSALGRLRAEGAIDALIESYGVAPIASVCDACP
jgi:polar amino acid transport system substrate-binding protein/cystine transport system substrate-binding protein/membrane-bound lytic murein transglycosylase F